MMLIPEWVNCLADCALRRHPGRCARGLHAVVGIVEYSAIDSGLNPDGLPLVSVAGVDRVANRDGLDGQP